MKKTTSICLFTGMIFLLLVMVVYLLFTQQDTGEKEQDLAAATEEMPAETDSLPPRKRGLFVVLRS